MSDPNQVPVQDRDNAIKDLAKKGDLATEQTEKVSKLLWGAEDEFGSIRRPEPTYEPENGVDFANGEKGALDAPGNGAAAAGFSEPIELVHFGVVYQDGREKFVAAKDPKPVDDTVNYESTPDNVRAVHFRDALQREAVLLAGFLRATKLAVKYRHDTTNSRAVPKAPAEQPAPTERSEGERNSNDREKSAGTSLGGLAGALGGVADLTSGGTGSKSMISENELEPFFKELQRIAPTIDGQTIEYAKLHAAGMDLHVLRCTYEKWITKSLVRLDNKPVDKGMLDALSNSLNPLGLGGPVAKVASVLGPIVKLVQKWATVTTDAYFHMTLDYSAAMTRNIVSSARLMSEDAIRRNAFPAFSVWMKPPPAVKDPNAPPAPPPSKPTILDEAKEAVNKVGNFLKQPVPRCPGTPFLDVAFEEPAPSKAGTRAEDRKGLEQRSVELPQLATRLVGAALVKHGVDLEGLGVVGEYVRDVITEGCRTVADFLHAVYGVTTTVQAKDTIDREHMLAAGRTHLVNKLVYLVLEKLKILRFVRGSGVAFGSVSLDPEALLMQGFERLASALEPALKAIDPILEFAMYELAADLNAARLWCTTDPASAPGAPPTGELTMEAYLAILPATYAKLVRHLVFFLVDTILKLVTDKVLNPALAAVGLPGVSGKPEDNSPLATAQKLAGGPLGLLGGNLGKAGDLVEKVSKKIRDVQELGNAIGKGVERAKDLADGKKYGYGNGPNDNAMAEKSISDGIDDIKNAKGPDEQKKRAEAAKKEADLGAPYPFPKRVVMGMGKAITDDELKAVVAEATKRKMKRTGVADSVTKKAVK